MASPFVDNPQKCVVREQWNTPLLRYLNTTYGVRYRYFGLPGVNLIDVNLWRDMIDHVVAFEPPSKDGNPRAGIDNLRRNMRARGILGRAYWGSFEEVVILGRDYEGTPYTQEKVVTLYNLDFCDEISSRVQTREKGKRSLAIRGNSARFARSGGVLSTRRWAAPLSSYDYGSQSDQCRQDQVILVSDISSRGYTNLSPAVLKATRHPNRETAIDRHSYVGIEDPLVQHAVQLSRESTHFRVILPPSDVPGKTKTHRGRQRKDAIHSKPYASLACLVPFL